jgi:hypothetical protein
MDTFYIEIKWSKEYQFEEKLVKEGRFGPDFVVFIWLNRGHERSLGGVRGVSLLLRRFHLSRNTTDVKRG